MFQFDTLRSYRGSDAAASASSTSKTSSAVHCLSVPKVQPSKPIAKDAAGAKCPKQGDPTTKGRSSLEPMAKSMVKRQPDGRVLIGGVENVRQWMKMNLPFKPLYIVFGQLASSVLCKRTETCEADGDGVFDHRKRILILQDLNKKSMKLRCVFYSIDRALPIYESGLYVRAIGNVQADGSLLCFSYALCEPPALQRLNFLSQRGLQLGLSQNQKL